MLPHSWQENIGKISISGFSSNFDHASKIPGRQGSYGRNYRKNRIFRAKKGKTICHPAEARPLPLSTQKFTRVQPTPIFLMFSQFNYLSQVHD